MKRRVDRVVPFVIAALILAGIAYPVMLLASGAALADTSVPAAVSHEPCDEPDEATSQTFPAGDAGTVTLERSAEGLRIASVDEAGGWTSRTKADGPAGSVAVVFGHDTGRVLFHASIVHCRVRIAVMTKLEARAAAAGATKTQTFDAADAGTVTVKLADGRLEVGSVDAADGWTDTIRVAGPGRHVFVRFRGDEERVGFHAKLRKGRMVVWVWTVTFVDLGGTPAPATAKPAVAATAEPTPTASPTRTAKPTAAPTAETETRTIRAGRAGTITLERSGDTLEVLSADANDGWSSETTIPGPAEKVVVTFTHERGFVLEVEAEVTDGRIRVGFLPDWSGIAPPPPAPTPPEPTTLDAVRSGSTTIEGILDGTDDRSFDHQEHR